LSGRIHCVGCLTGELFDMATKYWVGRAARVAQVSKIVFSSVTVSATYTITINGKSVSVVAATTVLADLVALFAGAWSSSAEPEHQEVTLAGRFDPTLSGVQLTCNTTGVDFTVSASATSGSATVTTPTAASGPNFWNVAGNWSGSTLPSAADDLVLSNSDVSILYGLTDTTSYASLTIDASYTGTIGLPSKNERGYPEYRTQHLTLGSGSAITVTIGNGIGSFSPMIKLDFGASNVTYTQVGSSSSAFGTSSSAIELRTSSSASTYRVYGGSLSVVSGSTATITTLDVIRRDQSNIPNVVTSNAITITTATVIGGNVKISGPCTTLVARDGSEVTTAQASAAATVRVGSRARIGWESSGGITTKLFVEAFGIIDFGRVATSKTIAACDLYASGAILDPLNIATFTNGIVLQACRLADVTLDVGIGVTINA